MDTRLALLALCTALGCTSIQVIGTDNQVQVYKGQEIVADNRQPKKGPDDTGPK